MIRTITEHDFNQVKEIYSFARRRMKENGNPNQWGDIHPTEDLILADIRDKTGYVIEENGRIEGVFAFLTGDDPTYAVIENGKWPNNKPYGVIHRIAAAEGARGVFKKAVEFALTKVDELRIDTHADNKIMQQHCLDFGFVYCGIIYVRDRSPRLAYQYSKQK